MKKIIMAIALGAAGIGAAFAAQPAANTDNSTCNAATECTAPPACCANTSKCSPFEGLNLTPEQQAKLDDLRKTCTEQRQQARADRKKADADRRQARENGRRDMLAKIKEILTPEQYVTFLENNFVNAGNKPAKAHGNVAQTRRHGHDKAKADRNRDGRRDRK